MMHGAVQYFAAFFTTINGNSGRNNGNSGRKERTLFIGGRSFLREATKVLACSSGGSKDLRKRTGSSNYHGLDSHFANQWFI